MAKHRKVDTTLAQGCMTNYVNIYKNASDAPVKNAYSDGTVFDKDELITYLKSIKTPSVKISFGVYTDDYVKKYPTAKASRLTTFLFPSTVIVPDIPLSALAYNAPGNGGDGGGVGDPLNLNTLIP